MILKGKVFWLLEDNRMVNGVFILYVVSWCPICIIIVCLFALHVHRK